MLCGSRDCTYYTNPDISGVCCNGCKEKSNTHDSLCKKREFSDTIPKQIFMCHKRLDDIIIYAENWRRLNPEYEIKLYDDTMCKDFLLTEFSQQHLDLFNYLTDGPIKADFWRLCIVYKYGGLYVDSDIEPIVPLRDYIDPTVDFVTCASYGPNFNPHFIMAREGDTFLKNCIDTYMQMFKDGVPYSYSVWSIMPLFHKLLLLKNYRKLDGIYSDKDGKKHQITGVVKAGKYYNDYNQYNGVKVFNNRYRNYDHITHTFKSS